MARGTIANVLATGARIALAFALSIILARGLGPAEYGRYGVVLSILVWIELTATLGLPGATSILSSRHPEAARSIERRALAGLLASGLVAYAVLWILAPVLARAIRLEEGTSLLRLAGIDLPFYLLLFGHRGILAGRRRFGAVALATVMYFLAKLLLVGGVVVLGGGLTGALLGNAAASVAALLLVAHLARRGVPATVEAYPTGRLLAFALSLGVSVAFLNLILTVDVWAVKRWASEPADVGRYVAAAMLARMLHAVLAALYGTLTPFLARALGDGSPERAREYVREGLRFVLAVVGLAVALVVPTSTALVVLLLGEPYRESGWLLAVLLPVFGIFGVGRLFLAVTRAAGRTREAAAFTGGVLILLAGLLLLLAPDRGVPGILTAMAVAGAALALVGIVAAARHGLLAGDLRSVAAIAASGGLVALGLAVLDPTGFVLVPAYALGLVAYAALLAAFRVVRREDLSALAFWRTRPGAGS